MLACPSCPSPKLRQLEAMHVMSEDRSASASSFGVSLREKRSSFASFFEESGVSLLFGGLLGGNDRLRCPRRRDRTPGKPIPRPRFTKVGRISSKGACRMVAGARYTPLQVELRPEKRYVVAPGAGRLAA